MNQEKLNYIQKLLVQANISGWLFYDFRHSDPLAYSVLGLDSTGHSTRRWFYLIPAEGIPQKLVHRIEAGKLDALPGEKHIYLSWEELREGVRTLTAGLSPGPIAMQYSPKNSIPYISKVDAGTVELVRSFDRKVVTSADLLQYLDSIWDLNQMEEHRIAAQKITGIVQEAFKETAKRIKGLGRTGEFEIQQFILKRFEEENLETDFPPIVGVNRNSGDPHYAPDADHSSPIGPGDFLLIDLWARLKTSTSVFADITWTAYFGDSIPERIQEVFDIVRKARDSGVELIREAFAQGRVIHGWEIDAEVRHVIEATGFGDYFIHRTGHNLGREVHGTGVHLDNLETHDTRRLLPGIAGTIEPGIYLDEFGVRSELNFLIDSEGTLEVTTSPQTSILLFKV